MPDFTYNLDKVVKVVDGDTVDLRVFKVYDFGFHMVSKNSYTGRFRIVNVDTPERGEPGFREAGTFVIDWLLARPWLLVDTYKDPDNFGRYLGDIYNPENGESLSAALLESGHAQPYQK